jgi:hypothetical protein
MLLSEYVGLDASNSTVECTIVEHNIELSIVYIEELGPPTSHANVGKTRPLAQADT